MWTGDNLLIMRGMNSESVDLIYLDPPFNSKQDYAAPIGSKAAGAEFKDTWSLSDLEIEWLDLIKNKHHKLHRVIEATMTDSDKAYLIYMAVRLLEMKRVLKETGSIYLHCDPTMSHWLKLMMDAVFGKDNFRNEIVWSYQRWTGATRHFQRMHDTILFYAKGQYSEFNMLTESYSSKSKHKGRRFSQVLENGRLNQNYTGDVWELSYLNSQAKERTGYPTQKPLKLLERIIKASSNESDIVFDPFCGCATTLVAAEALQRNWIGIDISPLAAELVVERIEKMQGLWKDITNRTDIPQRTDLGNIPPYNSSANKTNLYGKQGGYCNGCREHFKPLHFHVDHIIAKKRGGTDHIDNLQLLCGNCNSTKGDRGMEYLIKRIKDRREISHS